MSIKISEIKGKYFPTFETEEERLAYEEECRKNFAAAVSAKVEELKALYNSDKKKYSKFKNFTEEDWITYATNELNYYGASVNANYLDGTTPWSMKPENAEWARFTYEEILAMEANGTLIPDEVLAWAHSMEENDVTSYELNDDGSQKKDDEPASDFDELKANALKLGAQSKTAEETSKVKFEQMQELSKQAEGIKREQENSQKDSLKEIQDLTKEYDELAQRVKKGEKLDDGEQKRYQQLGSMLNGKDGELVTDVQASSSELEELINSIDGLNKDVKENVKLGNDTVEAARQLAWYEKGYKDMNTVPNFFVNVSAGIIREMLSGAQGKSVAIDALDNGENLIEYSNTLGNQLMMNQYASLYEFATVFTTNANETINATKEVMGGDFEKSSEEFEEEGELEGQETEEAGEKLNMSGLTTMGLGTRKLTEKVRETGKDSIKLAKEAIKELKKVNKKDAELQNEKQEVITEQAEEAQSNVQEENAEKAENPEKAQEETEQPENIEDSTKTEAVNGEIEANNEKGLTVKEKLHKSAEKNRNYDKFNKQAENVMDGTGAVGTVSTVYGGALIADGVSLIAAGTPLLSNMFTYPIGVGLIVQGTLTLTAGVGFVGVGTDLIAISYDGLKATDITGEQIDLTDETIQDAMETVKNGGLLEEKQMSEAESKRFEMIENGESLPKQARFFKGESNKDGRESIVEMIENGGIREEANKEGKAADVNAKKVEIRTKKDKKEYDELKEKAEKSENDKKNAAVKQAVEAGADPEKLEQAENDNENGFTEKDQERMEELEDKLQKVGDKAQKELCDSLTKIDGLEELLEGKDETALNSIDYGSVAQIVGNDLYNSSKGSIFLIFQMVLGLMTIKAGEFAEESGTALQADNRATRSVNTLNRVKIHNAQSKVTEFTMSQAQNPVAQEETQESGENTQENGEANGEANGEENEVQGVAETGVEGGVSNGEVEEDGESEAEGKRAEMIENGASLKEQAKFFKGESKKQGNEALGEIMTIGAIKTESDKEGKSAELNAKIVELKTKKDKKEYDELKEKAEKSGANEEDKTTEEAIAAGADPEDIEDEKEKDENGFSEKDQKRMEELEEKLVSTGDKVQQKLCDSLTKIDGLEEFLADKDEKALSAIDYGSITQIVGNELYDSSKGSILRIFDMILGLMTMGAGESAEETGTGLQESAEEASNVNMANRAKVNAAQTKVTEVTMAQAQSTVQEEGEEEETQDGQESTEASGETAAQAIVAQAPQNIQRTPVQTTAGTMNPVAQTSGKLTGAAAIAAWSDPVGHINELRAKFGIDPMEKKSDETQNADSAEEEDMQGQTEDLIADQAGNEKKGAESQKEAIDADKDAKKEDKKSQSVKKDAEKSEKQLTKEGQNITKLIEQDQKKVEELTNDSAEAAQEQLALMEEFEALNEQNSTIIANANQSSGAAAAPAPSPMLSAQNADNQQQGNGLLTGGVQQSGGMQDTTMAANQAQLDTNNQRLITISSRFTQLDVRINKNRLSMTKIQASINKRVNKFDKVTKQKIALQKKAQKAEEAKQKKIQKTLAALDIVATVFSILGSIATLMEVCGTSMQSAGTALVAAGTPMLSNPWTFAAGIVLCTLGYLFQGLGIVSEVGGISIAGVCAIGTALMQVAKAAVLLANGYSMQALTTLATAMITIAASAAGGAGAANGVMAGISAGLNIVSSGATLAADIQTLNGKEPSNGLNTVAQVVGMASAVTGAAAGFIGEDSAFSNASTLGKIGLITGAVGTAASTTAQISAMKKQSEGKAPGEFEKIMGMVGAGLSTAAAVMQTVDSMVGEGNGGDSERAKTTEKTTAESEKVAKKAQKAEAKAAKKQEKETAKAEKAAAKEAEKQEKEAQKDATAEVKPIDAPELPGINGGKEVEMKDLTKEALKGLDTQSNAIDNDQTAKDIENFDADTAVAEQKEQIQQINEEKQANQDKQEEQVVKKELEPVISDEQKAKVEAEMSKEPELEAPEKLDVEYKSPAKEKFEKQQKWEKTEKTIKNIGEGVSAGAQLYSSISGMMGDDEKEEQNRNVLHLSNKEKGYALMRKINRRRKVLAGYAYRNH